MRLVGEISLWRAGCVFSHFTKLDEWMADSGNENKQSEGRFVWVNRVGELGKGDKNGR